MSAAPKLSISPTLALARPDILTLQAYEHALWDPGLERLHANELPWRASGDNSGAGLNRYPEPQPRALVARLASLYGVAPEQTLVGRGSDEGIDLVVRAFCRAGEDAVLITPPTFGMYAVAARIQGAAVRSVPLDARRGFALDADTVLAACDPSVRVVFLCSPNNPTGNLLDADAMAHLARALEGRAILVVDEAYGEFAEGPGMAPRLAAHPNLVVLRTLSKAHGLAGARCGSLLAAPEIVALLRKLIPPYAITQLTVEAVLQFLEPPALAVMRERIALLRRERARLYHSLQRMAGVDHVWPSEANFLLASFVQPDQALQRSLDAGLLVRDVRRQPGLGHALRITVGTPEQNDRLLQALSS